MILEVFVAYLVAMVAIGIYEYRRTRGLIDYYIAGRRLGAGFVAFSFFATYFSTAAFLGGGGTGFILGFQWSAFLSFFHILFALLAWMVIAPPMRRIAEREGILTIPELLASRFGKGAQMIAAVVILFFFEMYMISIYKGASNLLQVMLGMDYVTGLLITAIVVVIYTAVGGFRAVVTTDFIQGVIILLGGVALFAALLHSLGGLEAFEKLANVEIYGGMKGEALFEFGKLAPPPVMKAGMVVPFVLSLTFAISVAQLASPQLVVRFIAARDDRVIARGMILTPLLVGVFALCVFSVGPFGWLVIPEDKIPIALKDVDLVVPMIAMRVFPESVNAILLTAIIAAAMSTINSLVHVAATAFSRDLLANVVKMSERAQLNVTRLAVFVFALLPLLPAVKPFGWIVEIVGISFSVITSAFLVPILAALYGRASSAAAVASMLAAVAVCGVWYYYFYRIYWIYPVVPGLAASIVTYAAVRAAESRR